MTNLVEDKEDEYGAFHFEIPKETTIRELILILLDVSWKGFKDYGVRSINFTENKRVGIHYE